MCTVSIDVPRPGGLVVGGLSVVLEWFWFPVRWFFVLTNFEVVVSFAPTFCQGRRWTAVRSTAEGWVL